jgi:hypothetical protein
LVGSNVAITRPLPQAVLTYSGVFP